MGTDGIMTLAFLGDIGGGELLVVFLAILFLFGGKRLPSIARSIGKATEDLRKASQDFKHQLMNADSELEETLSDNDAEPPFGAEPRQLSQGTPIPPPASTTPVTPPAPSADPKKEAEPRDLAG